VRRLVRRWKPTVSHTSIASACSSRRGWSTTLIVRTSSWATLICLREPILGGGRLRREAALRCRLSDGCAVWNVFRRTSCEVLKEAPAIQGRLTGLPRPMWGDTSAACCEPRRTSERLGDHLFPKKKSPDEEIGRGKFRSWRKRPRMGRCYLYLIPQRIRERQKKKPRASWRGSDQRP